MLVDIGRQDGEEMVLADKLVLRVKSDIPILIGRDPTRASIDPGWSWIDDGTAIRADFQGMAIPALLIGQTPVGGQPMNHIG